MRALEKKKITKLLRKLSMETENVSLFFRAMVHSSYANEQKQAGRKIESNERLEFLGDAVVDLLVCEILYKEYPKATEGEMSKVKAAVASEKILAMMARDYGIPDFLFLGKGEERSGGRERDSILADAMEALIAAVYLEFGFEKVKEIFGDSFKRYSKLVMEGKLLFDYKTALQEFTQEVFKELPKYKVVKRKNGHFEVEVYVNGKLYGRGRGRSKKEAEKEAAEEAYKALKGV